MKKTHLIKTAFMAAAFMSAAANVTFAEGTFSPTSGYLLVTDFVEVNSGKDVSSEIQQVIDSNPNRTIFFPDGEYLVSKPIFTPAHPKKSVSLKLANFAVIKAVGEWQNGEAIVQLGGIHPANDIRTNGSNYSFEGGIIDGNNIANGISINGGRETAVRQVSIKHAVVGLHIKHGANSGSSDSDISDVNIVGSGTDNSVGVLVEGYDNTFSNMRIANVFIGVHLKSGGNSLRNIHPLYTIGSKDYFNSCGFVVERWDNWMDYCYSDQFGIGFLLKNNTVCTLHDCFCYWYAPRNGKQTAIKSEKKFNAIVTNFRAGFRSEPEVTNVVLEVGEEGGTGTIDYISLSGSAPKDLTYKNYLNGKARKE